MMKPVIPADSVVTKVGPGKYNIEVNLNRKPKKFRSEVNMTLEKPVPPTKPQTKESPKPIKESPKRYTSHVSIKLRKPEEQVKMRPVPKPRTILQRERPVPKPRTILPRVRPVPKPRTVLPVERPVHVEKPTPPVRRRKPERQTREAKEQPPVVEIEEHEIDPFGTDLQIPGHRKIETAANGASVTYSISPQYHDPIKQLTSSRQVVRSILVNELKKMGGIKYTETLKVRMSKEVGNNKTKKDSVYFKSKTGTVTNFEDIEKTAAFN
jgi:hypothetical protein